MSATKYHGGQISELVSRRIADATRAFHDPHIDVEEIVRIVFWVGLAFRGGGVHREWRRDSGERGDTEGAMEVSSGDEHGFVSERLSFFGDGEAASEGNFEASCEIEFDGKKWWAWVDLNHRPRPYQGRALAT